MIGERRAARPAARPARATLGAVVLAAATAGACSRDEAASRRAALEAASGAAIDAASARAASTATAAREAERATATAATNAEHGAHASPRCRAIAVSGAARVELEPDDATARGTDAPRAVPLTQGSEVPLGAWLALDGGARVTVKDPRTARETTLVGPARAKPCAALERRDEETWLARGTFEQAPGAGERPGGEEWVVTPFGVVRYGAAAIAIVVGEREAQVRVTRGTAQLLGLGDQDAWAPVAAGASVAGVVAGEGGGDAGGPATLRGAPRDAASARAAVDRCAAAGRGAREAAEKVRDGAREALGPLALASVEANARARARCAVAWLRVDELPRSDPRRAALEVRLTSTGRADGGDGADGAAGDGGGRAAADRARGASHGP